MLLVLSILVLFDFQQIAIGQYNSIKNNIKPKHKVVALTFDDGPDPRFTPIILDILKQHHCKATFFMVGQNVFQHQDIVLKALVEGHEIENHTMTHPNLDKLPQNEVLWEINNCSKQIAKITGLEPIYFRPPIGQSNHTVHKAAIDLNLQEVRWTICIENRSAPTPELMAQRVLQRIKPGSIILLHDGRLDRTQTIKALPILLQGLKERGYQTVTLSQL